MTQRYGADHRRERARWAPVIADGDGLCHAEVCLEASRVIEPGEPWDLGHNPAGTAWTGPEHSRCNRSEGATRGNRVRAGGSHGSRDW